MHQIMASLILMVFIVGLPQSATGSEIWTFYTGESYLNAPEPALTIGS